MKQPAPQTPSLGTWVYGTDSIPDDDPTEGFHEASRLYQDVIDPNLAGGSLLTRSSELRASVTRAVRRRTGLSSVALREPLPLATSLGSAVRARRSARAYGPGSVSLAELSTLLGSAYGLTGAAEEIGQPLRAVPSGGALYPLELYLAALNVDDLEPALYHYDPLRNVIERLRSLAANELAGLTPYDELLVPSALVTMITAVFWRSRFKYGPRSYRFALLEAGHAAQNYVLAATSLDLDSCPVGGFYDRKVDSFLGVDGLYEASLYLLPVGGRER